MVDNITALILWHAGGGARVIKKDAGRRIPTRLMKIHHSINSTVAKIIQNNKFLFFVFFEFIYTILYKFYIDKL